MKNAVLHSPKLTVLSLEDSKFEICEDWKCTVPFYVVVLCKIMVTHKVKILVQNCNYLLTNKKLTFYFVGVTFGCNN